MKTVKITVVALVVMATIFQGWAMYVSSVEEQQYEVIVKYGTVEIRHYQPALLASVVNDSANGQASSGDNFRVLAGYIFGGNSAQQQIAMTAPVHMQQTDSGSQMSFVLPKAVWNQTLPEPNDTSINFHWSNDMYVAAIQYDGFNSEKTEATYRSKLLKVLKEHKIDHRNDFRFLGYDPPFKMVDRRNEVIVTIDHTSLP